MGGSCGREKSLPVLARYANLHESAHPIGVGEAENTNRLARSIIMPKSTKGASAPTAKPVLKLVSSSIARITRSASPSDDSCDASKACADELRYLLAKAERGELVGIALAYMTSGTSYHTEAIGRAYENPTFTLGMLGILRAKLEKQVLG
jgi:hypothetical protein